MTREEAIEQLQNCKDLIKQNGQDYLDERDFSLLDMAIEALTQDSSQDLISRQDAIKAFFNPESGGTYGDLDDGSEWWMSSKQIYGVIESLPSAEPKTGEWKRRLVDNGFNADWVCSECGYRIKTDFVSFNYCPNCGARMLGEDGEE